MWWPCTTDGRGSCTPSLCRATTRAASSAWTTSPGPGSRTKSTGMQASTPRGFAGRSSRDRNSHRRVGRTPWSALPVLLLAQVRIVAFDPVLPNRREELHDDGVFQSFVAVRDIRRHVDHLARLEHKFFVAYDHTHRAFFDDGDLIVDMVVRRHLVAFVKTEVRHGDGCAVKGFAPGDRKSTRLNS